MAKDPLHARRSFLQAHSKAPGYKQRPSEHLYGTHRVKFGAQISDQECKARDVRAEMDAILSGKELPYIFTGPPESCKNDGCEHGYWGRRCRFDGYHVPACPMEDRQNITSWMARLAIQGSQWATDSLALKPCDLWPQLRGRTTWVAGDSISQDMAYGLACFMIEYMDVKGGREIADDPVMLRSLTHSSNGKELSTWCFNMTGDTRICSLRANKAPRMGSTILRVLPSVADRIKDIVIMNFGAWYNYINGGMVEMEMDMPKFEEALVEHRPVLPHRLFWREATAQHFDTESGMFDFSKPISEQRCTPPGKRLGSEVEMRPDGSLDRTANSSEPNDWTELYFLLNGGRRNQITQPVVDRLGIETLRVWNYSLVVHDVHKYYHKLDSGGECVTVDCDCSHACSPSWYQMGLAEFNDKLRHMNRTAMSSYHL